MPNVSDSDEILSRLFGSVSRARNQTKGSELDIGQIINMRKWGQIYLNKGQRVLGTGGRKEDLEEWNIGKRKNEIIEEWNIGMLED